MRLKPDDLPDMELGEIRNITFNLAGAVGPNSISGTPTVESANLTFSDPLVDGTSFEVRVTASQVGTHVIIATAELDSLETIKGMVRVKVVDSTACSTGGRY